MNYCPDCAHPVSLKIPPEDTRMRYVCDHCHAIHYQNPKIVAGTLPVWDSGPNTKILLCRRAIKPRYGYWTLPAGFMENGETTSQAALRETIEEAGAKVLLGELFSLLNVPHVNQVHLFYRATLLSLDYLAGPESLEVKLFSESEIPWDDIAFKTSYHTIKYFFSCLSGSGENAHIYCHDILRTLDLT